MVGRSERGIALVVTLMALLVLASLTGALVPLTSMSTRVAANHRRAVQVLYAAEAALAWTLQDLRGVASWGAVQAGTRRSSFRVGSRQRQWPDGTRWDLDAATAELDRVGAGSSGVGRGLDWRLYAYGPFQRLAPRDPTGGLVAVAVWVAALEPSLEDALVLHAVAAGPGHARGAVQATLRRSGSGSPPRVVSWALVR